MAKKKLRKNSAWITKAEEKIQKKNPA